MLDSGSKMDGDLESLIEELDQTIAYEGTGTSTVHSDPTASISAESSDPTPHHTRNGAIFHHPSVTDTNPTDEFHDASNVFGEPLPNPDLERIPSYTGLPASSMDDTSRERDREQLSLIETLYNLGDAGRTEDLQGALLSARNSLRSKLGAKVPTEPPITQKRHEKSFPIYRTGDRYGNGGANPDQALKRAYSLPPEKQSRTWQLERQDGTWNHSSSNVENPDHDRRIRSPFAGAEF